MSSFVGPGPPECAYHIGYICFGSKAGVIAWFVIVVGVLLVGIGSGLIAWAQRHKR